MIAVTYDSNNSGGDWWLSTEQWEKLAEAGWNVHWMVADAEYGSAGRPRSSYEDPLAESPRTGETWLGAEATSAAKAFEDPADAIPEWEQATGEDASEEGCNCCGPPHTFKYEDADGTPHYATARVTATTIEWDGAGTDDRDPDGAPRPRSLPHWQLIDKLADPAVAGLTTNANTLYLHAICQALLDLKKDDPNA